MVAASMPDHGSLLTMLNTSNVRIIFPIVWWMRSMIALDWGFLVCINRESKSLELTIKLYSCHDIKMNFLVVVTPPSIYHGWSTWKTFWEEKFTGKQDLFESVNMKNCGCRKVRKHKEIKGSDKCVTLNIYVTLNISDKSDDLNRMETTSSES